MGQSMVAITEADCTGCDLCIPHCPFGHSFLSHPTRLNESTKTTSRCCCFPMRRLSFLYWFVPNKSATRNSHASHFYPIAPTFERPRT